MSVTRRNAIKAAFATVGGAASLAFKVKGCGGSKPDRRTLPQFGEMHWKQMFPGHAMQVGGNKPGKGWSAVGVVPSGDIVWIEGLDIGQ